MDEAMVKAIKDMIASLTPNEVGVYDIGARLDDAFQAAGYSLELHQQGISGTRVLAVKQEGN